MSEPNENPGCTHIEENTEKVPCLVCGKCNQCISAKDREQCDDCNSVYHTDA